MALPWVVGIGLRHHRFLCCVTAFVSPQIGLWIQERANSIWNYGAATWSAAQKLENLSFKNNNNETSLRNAKSCSGIFMPHRKNASGKG